jgi:hypothetical protein
LEYGMKEGNFDKVLVNDDLAKTFELLAKAVKAWYPHLKQHVRPRPVVFAGPSGVGKVSYHHGEELQPKGRHCFLVRRL